MKRALPILALVLSGAGSLVLEVVWTRFGILIFGSTTTAVTVVFSIFMLGLAIGNAGARAIVARIRNPFRFYALAELGTAFVSVFLSLSCGTFFSSAAGSATAFILAMLVATTLMGFSIPVIVRGLEISGNPTSWSVPLAYGTNTVGAATGALGGAFLIIPGFGLQGATLLAATGLILAAGMGYTASRGFLPESTPEPLERATAESSGIAARWLLIAFWGGASSLSMEIVWTRLLSLVLGPSVYALGTILFVYLLGIGLGSLVSGRILKRFPHVAVGAALLMLAATLAQSAFTVGFLPYLFALIVKGWFPSVGALRWIELLLSALALLPSAMVHGFLLPGLVPHLSASGRNAQAVAGVLSVNTFGSIVGALVTGILLIPRVGLLPIFLAVMFLHGVAGVWILRPGLDGKSRVLLQGLVFVVLTAVGIGVSQSWDRAVLSCGVYKYTVGKILAGGDSTIEVGKLLYYREGIVSTVSVTETANDVVLMIDGKADASIHGDRSTQVLLAALPLSLSRKTENALVIGYASGITAGVATLFPGTRVTSVEIEPAVYVAAERFFSSVNFGPLKPPLHRALVADGRHFLRNTRERFDVITSEPSNPWMAGVAPLFSREFFALAKSRLAPGGVMCQWLPIYGMSRELVTSILRTFHDVFPHVFLFASAEGNDLLLIGGEAEIDLNPEAAEVRWTSEPLKKELFAIRIDSGFDLIGRYMMGNIGIENVSAASVLNTDDNGYVEYRAPRSLHLHTSESNDRALMEKVDSIWPYLRPELRTERTKNELSARFRDRGKPSLAEVLP